MSAKYPYLSSIFYQNKSEWDKLYIQRYNSPSTFRLDIDIKSNPAFVVVTTEMVSLIEKINKLNIQLITSERSLPPVALDCYAQKCLVDEIMITNDIEGIYSTRKEVKNALEPKSDKNIRFKGLADKYKMLLSLNSSITLNESNNVRELYDQIVRSEIKDGDLPDGILYRKESVSVCSVTDTVKHNGLYPETEIIKNMDKSLAFLNNEEIPLIIRVSVFHYLVGYIHPFYDGNGRLNRFISSYYLNTFFNHLVGLRLSNAIKNSKGDYYKEFDKCNEEKNKGEITSFVLLVLKILISSVELTIKDLDDYSIRLQYYRSILKKIYPVSNDCAAGLFIIIQSTIFSDSNISVDELAFGMKISEYKTRNMIKKIIQDQIPILVTKEGNKNTYSIDLQLFVDRFDK